jgi:hypothetical protein
MEISTIVIANVDMICGSIYDPSCDMTKCAMIITIDGERRCVFAMYISVELEYSLCFMGAQGICDIFGFEG